MAWTPPALARSRSETGRPRLPAPAAAGTALLVDRACRLALLASGLAALAAALALAAVHVDDRYMVGHVSGAWIGLAAAARDGLVYPPLVDDGHYGGTRYFPLAFVLHAGASLVTGELLVSGKLLTYAAALAVCALVALGARRRGAPWPLAVGLVGALVAGWPASAVVFGVRGDALPVALALGALALLANGLGFRRVVSAGVLCALALAATLSAVWAPAAIAIWVGWRARRLLVPFAAAFAGVSIAVLGAVELVSRGRLRENVGELAFAGSGGTLVGGVERVLQLGVRDQRSLWPLLVAAAVTAAVAAARGGMRVEDLALPLVGLTLVPVMRDVGAYENHLFVLTAVAAVVVGGAWPRGAGRGATAVRVAVTAAVLLATALAARHTLVPDLRRALGHELAGQPDPRYTTRPLARAWRPGETLLSQDASIPLLAGERPVVLDPFMLPRLARRHPAALEDLRERIERRDFEAVVLFTPLEDRQYFLSFDFGGELHDAIERAYRLERRLPETDLYLYRPR